MSDVAKVPREGYCRAGSWSQRLLQDNPQEG